MTEIHPHHHADDHHGHSHHENAHHQPKGIIAQLAAALHLPGFSHTHSYTERAGDKALYDNELGIATVKIALLTLGITTLLQVLIYSASGSMALLADTVHNFGDALNSVPLWLAFILARRQPNDRYTYGYGRAEDIAGIFIVLSMAFSAAYILWESVQKLLNPSPLQHMEWVALAALVGFIGNEIVALLQIRVGRQIGSKAMVVDGLHARTDGLTSLAVLIAVAGTWLGFPVVDPIIGLIIALAIINITWSAAKSIWHRLMDAVDPQWVALVRARIGEHREITRIERLQIRWIGHRLHIEMALLVNNGLTLAQTTDLRQHLAHHLEHDLPNFGQATIELNGG